MAMDPVESSKFRGKSLVLVKRSSPGFTAFTPDKSKKGLISVNAAIRAGDKLVKEMKIVNPALDINKSVMRGLKSRYALTIAGITRKVAEEDDLEIMIKLGGSKDYVLDVATNRWGFINYGFNYSKYMVTYSATLRLIDIKAARVIAEGDCLYDWETIGKDFVPYEQLMANDAAVIKQSLSESVNYCTKYYLKNLFGA
jgi:hypothetical protein